MPFKSKAQARAMFAKAKQPGSGITPKMVKEWAEKTKSVKALPEKVGKKKKAK
jgi:hypothetical protein